MASTTPNLGLVLPDGGEKVSRQIINSNMTMIDGAVSELAGHGIPTVTGTETANGVMTITVECKDFAFGNGLVFPVLFPEDVQTGNVSTLMMDVGGIGAKNLELHVTATTTFNNIAAGVHFVECTTTPLEYTTGTEVYALYQTGICGTIDGMRLKTAASKTANTVMPRVIRSDPSSYPNDNTIPTTKAVWEYVDGQAYEPKELEMRLENIPSVTRAKVMINRISKYYDLMNPYSVNAVVEGGDSSAIAAEIYALTPVGYTSDGSISTTYTDSQGSHTVKFSRPDEVIVTCNIVLTNRGASLPFPVIISDGEASDIRQAVKDYINGLNIGEMLDLDGIRGVVRNALEIKAPNVSIDDVWVSENNVGRRNNIKPNWNQTHSTDYNHVTLVINQ